MSQLPDSVATNLPSYNPTPENKNHAPISKATIVVDITPGHPAGLAAGFGDLPRHDAIDGILDAATRKYASVRARANGPWGDFAAALTDNLNNSRMYSTISKRVANVIGRGDWIVTDPDYLPYFAWDTSFNSLLASLEDPVHAKDTLRTLLSYQLPSGMVAQIANWNHDPLPTVNINNSNPPIASLCAWKVHERWPDRSFLAEVYPKLLRWHDWWPKNSDGNHNGLLEWGANDGNWWESRLASGWDDTPAFDGSKQVGTQMNADAVDLNALWSMDAEYLAKIAAELGLKRDAERLGSEHLEMNRRINEILWNDELGMYCTRLWDDQGKKGAFLTRFTPLNFYPLICGAPDPERAQRVLNVLTDPGRFWGRWPIPTLEYKDPEWPKQDYWKGHVWGPANYLVWLGLRRYGNPKQKAELARRSVELFMRNWTAYGTCNENYKSSDGTGDRYPHYTWGALLCQIGIEYFYDIGSDGRPIPMDCSETSEEIELHNMPSGGKLYRITCQAGRVSIEPEQAGQS